MPLGRPPPFVAAPLAAALLCACATTPSGSPVPATPVPAGETRARDFVSTGSVSLFGGGLGLSADFSDFRVVGPRVNMTRSPDGSWAGDLDGRNLLLTVAPGRIDGHGVNLYVFRKGSTVSVQGMFGQRQVWFTMKPDEIQGTTDGGRCSFDMALREPGVFGGGVGCEGQVAIATLKLTGAAANLAEPVVPQLVLALLAVFR